jgi:hypothetical protein
MSCLPEVKWDSGTPMFYIPVSDTAFEKMENSGGHVLERWNERRTSDGKERGNIYPRICKIPPSVFRYVRSDEHRSALPLEIAILTSFTAIH